MAKSVRYSVLAAFGIFFILTAPCAYGAVEDPKMRLKEIREEKALIAIREEKEMHNVMEEYEKRLDKMKADFRTAREDCLRERDNRYKEIRLDYEGKLKSLMKEEKGLIEVLGPSATGDFVKTRVEKSK